MSPAPAEEVVLNCNNELELGGSLNKRNERQTELKGKGRFDPIRKMVSWERMR